MERIERGERELISLGEEADLGEKEELLPVEKEVKVLILLGVEEP